MQKTITLFLVLFTLMGCEKKEALSDEMDPIPENEDYYNCSGFFDTGDYSVFCTINSALVNISDSTIDGNETVCRYIIPPLDFDTEVETGVQFTSLETTEQAQLYYDSFKTHSDTSAVNDSLRFYMPIIIDGHEGYLSEGRYANYQKSLSVRYKNVLVTVAVVFYRNWYPVNPCNYEDDELTALMTEVLQNM